MNPTNSSRRPRAALFVRTLAVLAPLLSTPAFAQDAQPLPTPGAPAAVEAGGHISFAPVVKQVAQSVVTVSTSKAVKRNINLPPGVDERMLRRFFGPGGDEDGQNGPGMPGMRIGAAHGLDAVAAFLAGGEGAAEVQAEEDAIRARGIDGVPLFVINGQERIAGAQPAAEFSALLARFAPAADAADDCADGICKA